MRTDVNETKVGANATAWQIEVPRLKVFPTLIVLLLFFMMMLIGMLETRFPIFIDEAIYADIVNRFLSGHGFSTLLYEDFITNVELKSLWYPPVYFFSLSSVFALFGSGIVQARLFSIITAVAALGLLAGWTKKLGARTYSIVGVVGLLLFDHYFQLSAVVARMEMLTLAWGLGSLVCYWFFLQRKSWWLLFVTGVLAVLSILTHPMGVLFLGSIGGSVVFIQGDWKKKLLAVAVFATPVFIGLLMWLLSLWTDFELFIIQNQLQLHRKEFSEPFIYLVFRQQPLHRLLVSLYVLSNLFFILRIAVTQKIWQAQQIALLLLVSLASIVPLLMKEMWYLVYLAVIGSFTIVRNCEWAWRKKYWIMVGALPVLALGLQLFIFFEHLENAGNTTMTYTEFSQEVSTHLPEGAEVLLSSFPDPYFYLHESRPDLVLRSPPNSPFGEPIDPVVYNTVLSRIEYVVLSNFFSDYQEQYFADNLQRVVYSSQKAGAYPFTIIELTPSADRVPIAPPPEKTWEYPALLSQ